MKACSFGMRSAWIAWSLAAALSSEALSSSRRETAPTTSGPVRVRISLLQGGRNLRLVGEAREIFGDTLILAGPEPAAQQRIPLLNATQIDVMRHGSKRSLDAELSRATRPEVLRLRRGPNAQVWRWNGAAPRAGMSPSEREQMQKELREMREELRELQHDIEELKNR